MSEVRVPTAALLMACGFLWVLCTMALQPMR